MAGWIGRDPRNIAVERPDVIGRAERRLKRWDRRKQRPTTAIGGAPATSGGTSADPSPDPRRRKVGRTRNSQHYGDGW